MLNGLFVRYFTINDFLAGGVNGIMDRLNSAVIVGDDLAKFRTFIPFMVILRLL